MISKLRPFLQISQPVLYKRLHIPHFLTAVVALTTHQHRVNGLFLRQLGNSIRQLNTPQAPGAVFSSSAQISAEST